MIRFAPIVAIAALAGLASARQDETKAGLSGSALIDSIVRAKWESAEVKPLSRCDDAEFLRRVSLDLVGRIPKPEMAAEFLASKASDKREKLVDQLIAGDEYAAYWAEYWTGTFLGYDDAPQYEIAYYSMLKSMRELVAKTARYDEFATALLTVDGKTTENGLIFYWVRTQMSAGRDMPMALTGKFSRVFLGMQIDCAQCHDHPFDKWTQEDFYGMAGFFSKVNTRQIEPMNPRAGYQLIIPTAARPPEGMEKGMGLKGLMSGDLTIPGQKEPTKTHFLGTDKGPDKKEERRAAFARLLTAKDNAQFGRAAVNRYWGHFFGKGVVDPIDDFSAKNTPWSAELLDKMGADFVAHGTDIKWLVKAIVLSDVYQLTSKAKKSDRDVLKAFAQSRMRALSPEQIMHSVVRALGLEAAYAGDIDLKDMGPGEMKGKGMAELKAMREKRQLLDAIRQFRFNFGDDEGADHTEFQGTIPQALLMMNSDIVAKGLQVKGETRLAQILKDHARPGDRVAAIFLAVLSRRATEGEIAKFAAFAARRGDEGYGDVMWTLLNSSEFLLNH